LSAIFVDTSALAKRYVDEAGSAWVKTVTPPASGNVVIISNVTTVELSSLLARRVREGTLTRSSAARLRNIFLWHVEREYLVVALDNDVQGRARTLVDRHPLRALDAIQLAGAQRVEAMFGGPIIFISSDRNLLAAANAEGFTTDDPLAHP